MTELPIDTLIIIGLVIASFVGKFFQKKEDQKPKRTVGKPPADNPQPTIGDVLREAREAWQKATQPQESGDLTEANPPPLPSDLQEEQFGLPPSFEEKRSKPIHVEAKYQGEGVELPLKDRAPSSITKSEIQDSSIANYSWVKEELLRGSSSLKKAIVLKEILDQPKSLRSS
ncbi:MAG: hypothetical protein ACJZ7A_08880 [Opitutales bacterium]